METGEARSIRLRGTRAWREKGSLPPRFPRHRLLIGRTTAFSLRPDARLARAQSPLRKPLSPDQPADPLPNSRSVTLLQVPGDGARNSGALKSPMPSLSNSAQLLRSGPYAKFGSENGVTGLLKLSTVLTVHVNVSSTHALATF